MPAPLKLTREAHRIIITAIGQGLFAKQAAQLAGVDEKTLDRWIAKGRAGRAPFAALVRDLEIACAAAERDYVAQIQAAARGGAWQASAWILERRHPKRWGLQIRITVEAEQAAFLERLRERLTADEYARVIQASVDDELPPLGEPTHALPSTAPHH